jgi:hypothetical protein
MVNIIFAGRALGCYDRGFARIGDSRKFVIGFNQQGLN